jgi:hypothetical protein
MPIETSETYLCAGAKRLRIWFEHVVPTDNRLPGRRRRVRALEINGVAAGSKPVGDLNRALSRFLTEPRLSPQCFRNSFRVHLYEPEGGKSEYVDLVTDKVGVKRGAPAPTKLG